MSANQQPTPTHTLSIIHSDCQAGHIEFLHILRHYKPHLLIHLLIIINGSPYLFCYHTTHLVSLMYTGVKPPKLTKVQVSFKLKTFTR